jgi:hypothetical protein
MNGNVFYDTNRGKGYDLGNTLYRRVDKYYNIEEVEDVEIVPYKEGK